MEVCVERGRGYVPAEKREPEALPINAILLDADYSPVERVNFHVEPAAEGKERLVVEVWTDGSVAPVTAVAEASRILEDHFELLTNFPEATPEEAAAERDETRSEEHTSELQSLTNLVCRLLLEKKKKQTKRIKNTDNETARRKSRSTE